MIKKIKRTISLEQMFYSKVKGRPDFLIKEARQLFMLKIWDIYKLRLNQKIEFNRDLESIKMRTNINFFIRNAISEAIVFINGQNANQVFRKKNYDKKELYTNEKLNGFEIKKEKTIEDIILDYSFKGLEKKVATMIMEGFNEPEILSVLNITQHKLRKIKNKLKKIIKRSK